MEDSSERTDSVHSVERVVISRRPIIQTESPLQAHEIDWGEPMTDGAFQTLTTFVHGYVENLQTEINGDTAENLGVFIQTLATKVNADFPFIEQGTGVATISKQLDTYQAMHDGTEETKRTISRQSDCKLPTAIFSVACDQLKEKLSIKKVSLLLKKMEATLTY